MAIVLDTVVSDYLTRVKDALTTGTDLGSSLNAAAQNYLRAQDMATVLDLLQQALSATTPLTATGGSTTTIVDGASTFVAGEQVGNTVTIVTATESIVGETAVVVSNDTTTLTVSPAFSATVTAADTYTIEATFLATEVDTLREGKGVADATVDPYGAYRDAIAGLTKGVQQLGGTLQARNIGRPGLATGTGSTDTAVVLETGGVPYRIDELRGMNLIVGGEQRVIAQNTEDTCYLRGPALASAPAPAAGVIITVPITDFGGTSAPKIRVHPGAQPGENAVLADFIDQFQTLVEAATVPT